MDALARLAPVARDLLRQVDAELGSLGAPAGHPVWPLLGSVGATPADLVAQVADLEPDRLHAAAVTLREQARAYASVTIPSGSEWEGTAAEHYAAAATALAGHLAGDGSLSLAGRLAATASYVEELATWQQEVRDSLARMLARVMTSNQAVTLRLRDVRPADPAAVGEAVVAAADIGAALLGVADDAVQAGQELVGAAGALDELPYRPPQHTGPSGHAGTIRLS